MTMLKVGKRMQNIFWYRDEFCEYRRVRPRLLDMAVREGLRDNAWDIRELTYSLSEVIRPVIRLIRAGADPGRVLARIAFIWITKNEQRLRDWQRDDDMHSFFLMARHIMDETELLSANDMEARGKTLAENALAELSMVRDEFIVPGTETVHVHVREAVPAAARLLRRMFVELSFCYTSSVSDSYVSSVSSDSSVSEAALRRLLEEGRPLPFDETCDLGTRALRRAHPKLMRDLLPELRAMVEREGRRRRFLRSCGFQEEGVVSPEQKDKDRIAFLEKTVPDMTMPDMIGGWWHYRRSQAKEALRVIFNEILVPMFQTVSSEKGCCSRDDNEQRDEHDDESPVSLVDWALLTAAKFKLRGDIERALILGGKRTSQPPGWCVISQIALDRALFELAHSGSNTYPLPAAAFSYSRSIRALLAAGARWTSEAQRELARWGIALLLSRCPSSGYGLCAYLARCATDEETRRILTYFATGTSDIFPEILTAFSLYEKTSTCKRFRFQTRVMLLYEMQINFDTIDDINRRPKDLPPFLFKKTCDPELLKMELRSWRAGVEEQISWGMRPPPPASSSCVEERRGEEAAAGVGYVRSQKRYEMMREEIR